MIQRPKCSETNSTKRARPGPLSAGWADLSPPSHIWVQGSFTSLHVYTHVLLFLILILILEHHRRSRSELMTQPLQVSRLNWDSVLSLTWLWWVMIPIYEHLAGLANSSRPSGSLDLSFPPFGRSGQETTHRILTIYDACNKWGQTNGKLNSRSRVYYNRNELVKYLIGLKP